MTKIFDAPVGQHLMNQIKNEDLKSFLMEAVRKHTASEG